MLVELIALMGASTAGLALFLVVRDSDVDPAIWLAAWPILALEGALIVGRQSAPWLGYTEQFVGPWVPALQLAGALLFVGRRPPRWLLPTTVAVSVARVALAAAAPDAPRYAVALTFDCAIYGLATWALALAWRRQSSVRLAALAIGLGAMTLVNLANTVRAIQGHAVSSVFWVLWVVVVIPNFAMQVGAVLGRSRERAREALRAARRDVTTMVVGGVAHDFNNLLTIISGYAQLAEVDLRLSRTYEVKESLGVLRHAVERASTITRRLLEHVEAVPHAVRRLQLEGVTAEVCARRNASPSSAGTVHFAAPERTPLINGDQRLLETAIDLLIQNAIESGSALPIGVRVAEERTDRPLLGDAETSVSPGHYVSVTITDRGSGIPDDVRARLFQPYFSTREVGRGLGLAAVAGIARLHGGMVKLQTSTAGTSVTLWFPSVDVSVSSEEAA